mmetsp:Transcript_35791/g.86923  ORF Transcript_35791/g.86923 Transcript_35791/m.86923 type:complete len:215 (+) Transcript_35791:526-1170(+)
MVGALASLLIDMQRAARRRVLRSIRRRLRVHAWLGRTSLRETGPARMLHQRAGDFCCLRGFRRSHVLRVCPTMQRALRPIAHRDDARCSHSLLRCVEAVHSFACRRWILQPSESDPGGLLARRIRHSIIQHQGYSAVEPCVCAFCLASDLERSQRHAGFHVDYAVGTQARRLTEGSGSSHARRAFQRLSALAELGMPSRVSSSRDLCCLVSLAA